MKSAREFLVQTKDPQFKNTWQDVSAMRGTGSNAFSVEDLFVPEGLVVAPNDPPRINRPYFRAPVVFHILPSDSAVILGIVESVLDSIIPASSKQKAAVTGERRRDQAATQELIVECTYMFRSAQAVLREVTDLASRRIEKGEEIGAKQRAELYAISTQIFDVGRKLASELFAGGTRRCLERVVTAELDYVEGLAWLTLLYADQYHHHWDEPDQGYDSRARAVRHGERAVALDDGNPRARAHPGFAVFVSGERGIAEMNRFVELNPNN